jgi:hypothetical protein
MRLLIQHFVFVVPVVMRAVFVSFLRSPFLYCICAGSVVGIFATEPARQLTQVELN